MSKIVSFDKAAKSQRQKKARAATLCGNGHHKWLVDKNKQFDPKEGKLVTVYRCKRCGLQKVTAH